jgi:phenylpropionate dioxygenase-like ring-hydroxylating dioxygenase large terminal subunit
VATQLEDIKIWRESPPEKAAVPADTGHPIDGYRYYSPEFFAQEWEEMWTKVWLVLGRESEIPEPGDYQMEEVGPESFIMVRQKDMSIKAYYNVCQHRAARLVFNDLDSVDAFICPYHGWRWELDGTLTDVRDAEDFPEGDPCGKLELVEVSCDTFGGFIWINMNDDCESLQDYLGPIWDDWQAYGVDKWKRYMALTGEMPNNWKVIQDNFNESYHLPTVHPESDSSVEENYRYTQFDMFTEGHARMWMQSGTPSHMLDLKPGDELPEVMKMTVQAYGMDPEEFKDNPYGTRAALQKAKREYGEAHGYDHYENLKDHQMTDTYHYTIFPNFAVSMWSDGLHFLRARPHATDATKCVFDNWWYASQPSGETGPVNTAAGPVDRDAEVDHEVFAFGEKSMGFAIDQDLGVTPGQQLGLRSRAFKGVYLSNQEHRIRRYHEVIDEYINGVRPGTKT